MKYFIFLILLVFHLSSVKAEEISEPNESFSGKVQKTDYNHWKIYAEDDNGDEKLQNHFRSWWYVEVNDIDTGAKSKITVSGDGWNGVKFAPPVYSYDGKNWTQFDYRSLSGTHPVRIGERLFFEYDLEYQFDQKKVYIARYFPYTYSDLRELLSKYNRDKWLKIDTIGLSAQGREIYMLTVTNPEFPDNYKKRIWIHSRTHPSETASSFAVQGIIDYLLSDNCSIDFSKIIFNIVPMVNPDGVVHGLSRNSTTGENLEEMWFRSEINEYELDERASDEVKVLHSQITTLVSEGPEIIAAINLHSNNPSFYMKPYPFVFSNFGGWEKYGDPGRSMFIKHGAFLKFLNDQYCVPIMARSNPKTKSTIDKKEFPESWWWVNFKDKVMAMTIETSPELILCGDNTGGYKHHLELGRAISDALYEYYLFSERFNFGMVPESYDYTPFLQYWEGLELNKYSK